jgi:hypothetical protein
MKTQLTIEQKICPVTGNTFDKGYLFNKENKEAYSEERTITGFELHPEVSEHINNGFVAIVGVDVKKSKVTNDTITPMNAHRTGKLIFLKESVFTEAFKMEIPEAGFIFTEDIHIDKFIEPKTIVKSKTKYIKKAGDVTKNTLDKAEKIKRKYTKKPKAVAEDVPDKPKRKYTRRKKS